MDWDANLDQSTPAYSFAVNTDKTIRVLAGPGTGKSYGLQKRIARLLVDGVDPKRILAVTFTRTAAQDLRKSISEVGVAGSDKIIAKTLHSFCFALLNRQAIIESTGRYPRPMIYHELIPMLYDLGNEFGTLNDKRKKLEEFEANWARFQDETPGIQLSDCDKLFEKAIMNWLCTHKAMIIGEMIRETYKYLRDNPQCAEKNMFDHVLVDEYQDLNKSEQLVIDFLADKSNIAVIGDDDQSIYSFKYAHPEGIREFPNKHSECISIDFAQCRRCPKQVVDMASTLISNNTNRTLGNLLPFESNPDGDVKIIQFKNLQSEIEGISNLILNQIAKGNILPQDVLILVPLRKIGYRIRSSLESKNVLAKSYFRDSALRTNESRIIYSLINLLARPNDLVAWRFLLGVGSDKYNTKSYKRVLNYSHENNEDILSVLDLLESKKIKIPHTIYIANRYTEIKKKLNNIFAELLQDRKAIISLIDEGDEENGDLRSILSSIIEEVGVMDNVDINEWLKKIHSSIVEHISFPQNISEQDHVRIMSLHASKGLSAKFVVIMSCIDELLPRVNIDATPEIIRKQIEEQRRLFYVGITRCKCSSDYSGTLIISSFVELPGKEALQFNISSNSNNIRRVRASRFISEFRDTAPDTISLS